MRRLLKPFFKTSQIQKNDFKIFNKSPNALPATACSNAALDDIADYFKETRLGLVQQDDDEAFHCLFPR